MITSLSKVSSSIVMETNETVLVFMASLLASLALKQNKANKNGQYNQAQQREKQRGQV